MSAIASAALPQLSSLREAGDDQAVVRPFVRAARLSLFVALPSAAVLLLLAEPLIALFLEGGPFGKLETRQTANALVPYALAIAAVAVLRVVLPVFHAYNDTKTPVVASAANLAVFVAVSRLLMPSLSHVGIAVAAATASFVQLFLLVWLLRRKLPKLSLASLGVFAYKSLLALGPTSGVLYLGHVGAASGQGPAIEVAAVFGSCIAAGGLYLVVANALGLEESRLIWGILRRKRSR